ncbi:probably inactive leucine-rich repeat receptor-like protein kinase IMK2 [Magnolia sinica]|uniref:probably inactive leucine-rich repeat receptor-like protein kinase IMK2 n=1 Tax=Magnolia sinica TaxID=86752 RepID=UPI002658C959|nr:probably inactive leucine-rich repeat receptor-like protein kinase IMK2 [Magnolia sinica]
MELPHLIFKESYQLYFQLSQFLTRKQPHRSCILNRKKWKNPSRPNNPFRHSPLVFLLLLLHLLTSKFPLVSSQGWDGIIVTQADYQALQAFKHALYDPKRVLRSWNDSGLSACSGGWIGIKCVRGQVISIQLPWKGLGGQISDKVGQLLALRKLSLHDNLIVGQVPSSLGFLPNLRGVSLFNNRLSGSIPQSIGSCLLLQTLDLSNNSITGSIPESLSNSTRLYRLNLSYNGLAGRVPSGLSRIPSLTFLALQHNNLSGSIPDSWGGVSGNRNSYQLRSLVLDYNSITGRIPPSLSKLEKLEEISLSHNKINGSVPEQLKTLSQLQTLDLSNNDIDGRFSASLCNLSSLVQLNLENNHIEDRIPEAIDGLKRLSILKLRGNKFSGPIPATLSNISGLSKLDLSQNNLTGGIPASIANISNLQSFNVSYNNLSGPVPFLLSEKFNSSCFRGNSQLCGYSVSVPCQKPPSQNLSPPKPHRGQKLSTKDIILIAAGALLAVLLLVCCVLLCCLIRKRNISARKSPPAGGAAGRGDKAGPAIGEVESGGEAGGKLVHFDGPMVFTADDLLCATAEIMGKSTYGTVYKATLEDGNQVAVKRLREKIAKNQREFEVEVNTLGKIRHPNLLALRAYYLGPKGEKLLVFDFMPKGSLASFLHARGPDTPIEWATRMKIAIGAARGLCYLHTNENIHGNLTSSNILIDDDNNAKIADFGLSRLMTTAANSNVIATAGALGYRAPELSKLKKASPKTDVYSLGVIILELLTGKSPGEAMNGIDLPQWVASIVKEEWTNEVFDLELMRDASTTGDELLNTLKLALHCVDPSPAARPEVHQLLQQLEEIKPEFAGAAAASGSGDDGTTAEAPSAGD